MAHWQFAFDYFRLSYKTKLRNDNKPVDTNSTLLNAFNYTLSAVITMLAAAEALAVAFDYVEVKQILFGICNSTLVLSLLFMSYGLWLLTKIAKINGTQANAGTISVHIFSYVLVILAEYSFYIDLGSVTALESAIISISIATLFSSLMLAWVVYKLSQNTDVLATFET